MSASTSPDTLYRQLGGREPIAAVVDDFYRRVAADALLAPSFAGLDLARQRRHLAAFLGVALGGPSEYRGRGLRQAHAGLGITPAQFAAVAGHLGAALDACGVPAALADSVLAAVAATRDDIVGR